MHALLRHLEARGFAGAPRVLGLDEQGREVLSYLPGETVGISRPRPAWVHTGEALVDVGHWLDGVIDGLDRAMAELTETAATFQDTD